MFSVIFEVQPKDAQHRETYLGYAKELKPELEQIDGFIDNERFESRLHEGRVLSLSTWRDEKAVIRWRTRANHHRIQEKGRFEIFADYFLRVGEIMADTHVPAGQVLREQRFDETEIGSARVVTIVEVPAGADGRSADDAVQVHSPVAGTAGLTDVEVFDSIYNPGKVLILAGWRDETALAGAPRPNDTTPDIRYRTVRVVREYGRFDRREAPQYYADVAPPETTMASTSGATTDRR